jgi:hypothetical protein
MRSSGHSEAQALPELLSLPAAARKAGVGVRHLRHAIRDGDLPRYRVGAWPRVKWCDVLRWIDAQRVPVTSHARSRVAEVLARESCARTDFHA